MNVHIILLFVETFVITAVQQGCPSGHNVRHHGNSCYEFIMNRLGDWNRAHNYCQARHAHLVDIQDAAEQQFIYNTMLALGSHYDVWTGLKYSTTIGQWKWESGSLSMYTNWEQGQPNTAPSNNTCVLIQQHVEEGKWRSYKCTDLRNFGWICEYVTTLSTTPSPTPSKTILSTTRSTTTPSTTARPKLEGHTELCPPHVRTDANQFHGFIGQYGDYCYELVVDSLSRHSAEVHCGLNAKGLVLEISNENEQLYIERFLVKHEYIQAVWIGLKDKDTEGTLEWNSGRSVTYTNFKDHYNFNSPSHHKLNDCFVLEQCGQWNDVTCGILELFGEKHSYICQYNITSTRPSLNEIPGQIVG